MPGQSGQSTPAGTRSRAKEWCCQTGLNCRPLHYQWSALPLSYGSMPRIRESAQRAPTERADPCHKAPIRASAAGGRKASKTAPQEALGLFPVRSVAVRSGSHLLAGRLSGLGRVDHDLEFDHFAGLPPCGVLCDKAAMAFNPAGTSLIGLFSPGILKDFVKNSTKNSANDFQNSKRRVDDGR